MAGWYEVRSNAKGQTSFVLKADSGEVVLRSEQYDAKASAESGIASVQKNCGTDGRFERKDAVDGRCYFNLKAGNGQVIGTSPMYKTAAERDNALAAVKASGASKTIKTAAA